MRLHSIYWKIIFNIEKKNYLDEITQRREDRRQRERKVDTARKRAWKREIKHKNYDKQAEWYDLMGEYFNSRVCLTPGKEKRHILQLVLKTRKPLQQLEFTLNTFFSTQWVFVENDTLGFRSVSSKRKTTRRWIILSTFVTQISAFLCQSF